MILCEHLAQEQEMGMRRGYLRQAMQDKWMVTRACVHLCTGGLQAQGEKERTVIGWGCRGLGAWLVAGRQEQPQPREESDCFPVILTSVR